MERVSTYLPMDRRHALAVGHSLPDRAEGAALFADIAGFTHLTDTLAVTLGPRRGAEELIRLLNDVYDALITQVHRYGGSVVGFSGDGFTCWFNQDTGQRATACGLALHQALRPFASVPVPGGGQVSVSLKVAVAAGPVRRFLVGDPQVQRLDLLAGATLERLALAEQQATQGKVLVGPEVVQQLGEGLEVTGWRPTEDGRGSFAVAGGLTGEVPPAPWPELDVTALSVEAVRPFLLPPVYERLVAGQGEFLAELRPAVALFLRFGGLDYDADAPHPEAEAGARLDAYVRWVQGVLARYDGYLLQLTSGEKGNYLYASFGALTVHEDDAARAIAAAMELLRLPPDLSFVTGVQVGLSQGRVRAGAYGSRTRRTYGAQGDEVNVAARLMQAAPPGEVRCSGAIYEAAKASWAFEALPPVEVKGKAGLLPVYRPLGRRGERAARVAGDLVGRQAEMATLARLLEEVASGRRRVLLLEGEAGIGKSRLLAELARLAQERNVAWLEGAGRSIEQGTPYRAWRDLLAGYFGLGAQGDVADARAEQQRRVREQVTGVNPALVERVPLLNDILRLDLPETDLTRGLDPKLRRESLTWLVVDLLRDAISPSLNPPPEGGKSQPDSHARRSGGGLHPGAVSIESTSRVPSERGESGELVLVLEDAHWLDSLSWELALAVARALYNRPLLLVLALRPLEGPAPVPAAYSTLAGLEGAETVRLETLPPDETVALAAARLGLAPEVLPAEVADLVRERAGGNPFFAEELAHALRDSGDLVVEEGACSLTVDLEALHAQVPDTVEGVVLSRIDRLPPEQQLTLKVAAVVGRSFLYRIVRDVHPGQVVEDLLRTHLDDLARRDLTPLEALEPELTYLFKHIITQQVAYDTLLFAQRRALHRAVAGWYEQVYGDNLSPYYPLLVHHWHRAEEVTQERHYARLAGEQAAAQYANAEAVDYLSRALELTPQDDASEWAVERYALLLAREKVYDLQGERKAQRQDLIALQELVEALDDEQQATKRRAEVALRQSNYSHVTDDYPVAAEAAQLAIRLAQAVQDVHAEAVGYLKWGQASHRQGDHAAARRQLEQALSLGKAAGSRRVEADSLHILGIACHSQSDYAGARIHYEQALHIRREIGDRLGESDALSNLGRISAEQGNHAQAKAYYEPALHISREIGSRVGETSALNSLGAVSAEQGDYVRARAYFEQTLHISREIGNRLYEGSAICNLGEVSAEQSDYAGAKICYEQGLHIFREIGYRQGEAMMLSNLGLLSHHLGDDQAALGYSQKALLIAQELGDRYVQGYALTNLGHALAGLVEHHPISELVVGEAYKRLAEAADAYRQALDLRRELGQHNVAMETLAGLVRVSLAQGDLTQAQIQVEEILGHLETGSLDGAKDPVLIYWTCYRLLHHVQDPRAREILITAYDLLQEQAAKIEDKALRRSFLENVAAHRELVAIYRARQEEP